MRLSDGIATLIFYAYSVYLAGSLAELQLLLLHRLGKANEVSLLASTVA